MYALFPGHGVMWDSPLRDAFERAEDNRCRDNLQEASSWGMIYQAGVYARLNRGEDAYRALAEAVRNCCMNNLFTVHNDWRRMGSVMCHDMQLAPFQIDANIGFPAVADEMLLNSADGRLLLFPALPAKWQSGHLNGVCAVGMHRLNMEWDETKASVTVEGGRETTVLCGPGWRFADGTSEKVCSFPAKLELVRI